MSSSLLEEDKDCLRQYLMYKCLIKFCGTLAVDVLYEGRQRNDGEMIKLIQERR